MLPTLTVTLPSRPEAAMATPPDCAADAASPGPGAFARVLREAEAPDAAADPAPERANERRIGRSASRERTGPDRARAGDTPEAGSASRASAAHTKGDATETRKTDTPACATSGDGAEEGPVTEASVDGSADADPSMALPDSPILALPALPASRIATGCTTPPGGGDATATLADGAIARARHREHVGSHALPSRHPLATADAQAGPPAGVARPVLPGDTRAAVDASAADPALRAAAAAAKLVATEPVVATHLPTTMVELTTTLPQPAGASAPLLDGLAGRIAADPARPVIEARVTAEPGSPAFTQALGEQMGVWVRDGVQEARIQLNPADLGPVQIQIALDGQTALVDFHATHARTREAIEASLPALASALRESGFTLAGGGVFGQGGGDTPARTPPRARHDSERTLPGVDDIGVDASGDDGLITAARHGRGWRRGLLDVFA